MKTLKTASSDTKHLQRELWVLDGMLTHDLDQELLEQICKKFSKIDCVPRGYFYPELYAASPKQLDDMNTMAEMHLNNHR